MVGDMSKANPVFLPPIRSARKTAAKTETMGDTPCADPECSSEVEDLQMVMLASEIRIPPVVTHSSEIEEVLTSEIRIPLVVKRPREVRSNIKKFRRMNGSRFKASPTAVGNLQSSEAYEVEDLEMMVLTSDSRFPPVVKCPSEVRSKIKNFRIGKWSRLMASTTAVEKLHNAETSQGSDSWWLRDLGLSNSL